MGNRSKRNRRRMQQNGLGRGLSLVYRLPKGSWRPVTAAELSPTAVTWLRMVMYLYSQGTVPAMEAFQVSRSTVYRWRDREDPRIFHP